jgi:hypothetical protein
VTTSLFNPVRSCDSFSIAASTDRRAVAACSAGTSAGTPAFTRSVTSSISTNTFISRSPHGNSSPGVRARNPSRIRFRSGVLSF